ncbi:MAG: S24 family peptidase [Chloroflexi bacterium]|nr:S24 family peptidase [Chloroflexota bacterium]
MLQRGIRSYREVARQARLSPDTVSRLMLGERVEFSTIKRLALWSGVSLEQLMDLWQETDRIVRLRREQEARARETGPVLVPKTEQPAAAGYGIPSEAEYVAYYPEPWQRNHTFIAVDVRGDCMEPRIHDGETVVVDITESPRPGDIVLAVHDGETLLKILERRSDGLYLVALRHRPPIRLDETTRIIGVVKQVVRKP